jgi:hypothetical protein
VVGQPGPALVPGLPGGLALGQGGGVSRVQPDQLARQDLVQDGLVQQRVAEAVGAGALIGHQQAVLHAGPQVLVEVARCPRVQHCGQQVVLHLAAADRAGAQHCGGLVGHELHPADHRVPQLRRHGRAGVVGQRGGQLLHEQRVAVRALHHARDHLGRRWRGQQGAQQLGHLAGTETVERHRHCPSPGQLGGKRAQRMAARHVVAPVGGDE